MKFYAVTRASCYLIFVVQITCPLKLNLYKNIWDTVVAIVCILLYLQILIMNTMGFAVCSLSAPVMVA